MSAQDAHCPVCGQGFAAGEPRYRRPDGDVHARCFKGPRVLVVDDDALFRDLVARAVRHQRYCQVDTVSDGHAALERVRTHVYDLILSDLHMQVMDGPTFYRRMQVEHPDIVERIVFMTSQVDHYAQFIRDVGARVLRKPFRKEDLDAILTHVMGLTRASREGPREGKEEGSQ
jgi:CheY-like chemotaxis protein